MSCLCLIGSEKEARAFIDVLEQASNERIIHGGAKEGNKSNEWPEWCMGQPRESLIPRATWKRLLHDASAQTGRGHPGPGGTQGDPDAGGTQGDPDARGT